jgi:hypothetical protein
LPIAEMLGAVFIAVTVSPKLVGVLATPSVTVTVMVAPPTSPGAGVRVTVRFAPLPPNVMLPFGTSS